MVLLISWLLVRGGNLWHARSIALLPHRAVENLIRLNSQGIHSVFESLIDPQSAVHGIYSCSYGRGGTTTTKSQVYQGVLGQSGRKVFPIVLKEGLLCEKLGVFLQKVCCRATASSTDLFFVVGRPIQDVRQDIVKSVLSLRKIMGHIVKSYL